MDAAAFDETLDALEAHVINRLAKLCGPGRTFVAVERGEIDFLKLVEAVRDALDRLVREDTGDAKHARLVALMGFPYTRLARTRYLLENVLLSEKRVQDPRWVGLARSCQVVEAVLRDLDGCGFRSWKDLQSQGDFQPAFQEGLADRPDCGLMEEHEASEAKAEEIENQPTQEAKRKEEVKEEKVVERQADAEALMQEADSEADVKHRMPSSEVALVAATETENWEKRGIAIDKESQSGDDATSDDDEEEEVEEEEEDGQEKQDEDDLEQHERKEEEQKEKQGREVWKEVADAKQVEGSEEEKATARIAGPRCWSEDALGPHAVLMEGATSAARGIDTEEGREKAQQGRVSTSRLTRMVDGLARKSAGGTLYHTRLKLAKLGGDMPDDGCTVISVAPIAKIDGVGQYAEVKVSAVRKEGPIGCVGIGVTRHNPDFWAVNGYKFPKRFDEFPAPSWIFSGPYRGTTQRLYVDGEKFFRYEPALPQGSDRLWSQGDKAGILVGIDGQLTFSRNGEELASVKVPGLDEGTVPHTELWLVAEAYGYVVSLDIVTEAQPSAFANTDRESLCRSSTSTSRTLALSRTATWRQSKLPTVKLSAVKGYEVHQIAF